MLSSTRPRDESVEADDRRRVVFHCTADGSRTIAPDASVAFEVVVGHLGR